jgi:hypothetical protein
MSRLRGVGATIIALATVAFGAAAGPAGAAAKNPCKVLTKAEIVSAFGGTVSTPRKLPSTAVTAQCEYTVGANGDRPAGTVIVSFTSPGAKPAYDRLERRTSAYSPIDGVPRGLYGEKVDAAYILRGAVLLGIQGSFTIIDPLPIHFYDDRQQLTDLVKIGIERV